MRSIEKETDQKWSRAWRARQPEYDALLRRLQEQRGRETYDPVAGAEIRVETHQVDVRRVKGITYFGPPVALLVAGAERTGQRVNPADFVPTMSVPDYFFDDVDPPEPVVETCRHMLDALRAMVAAYDADHPSASRP